jgi:hypothetical protein
VIKSLPKWTPGSSEGNPVRVTKTLSVNFKLVESPEQTSDSNITQNQQQTQLSILNEKLNLNNEDNKIVTDIDGNEYHTVKIGTQVWMVENLKTTKYRNGDPIPKVDNNDTWKELKNGAYCNYNNDESVSSTYGKLYNWYVVSDSRNIAPIGWHIPAKEELETLIAYLNVENDNLGFKIIHGGMRWGDKGDYSSNKLAYLWSSTITEDSNSKPFWYFYHHDNVYGLQRTGDWNKNLGYSIRCIKDK